MGNQTTAMKATLGGALALALVLILNYILHATGHDPLPAELGQALGVVFTGLFTFFVPASATVRNPGGKAAPLAILLVAGLGASSCTNPLAVAQTPMQKAFAVYGTFTVAQGVALDVLHNEEVPQPVRAKIQLAEGLAYPAVEAMATVARTVFQDYPEGPPPDIEQRLVVLVGQAGPKVVELIDALSSARGGR